MFYVFVPGSAWLCVFDLMWFAEMVPGFTGPDRSGSGNGEMLTAHYDTQFTWRRWPGASSVPSSFISSHFPIQHLKAAALDIFFFFNISCLHIRWSLLCVFMHGCYLSALIRWHFNIFHLLNIVPEAQGSSWWLRVQMLLSLKTPCAETRRWLITSLHLIFSSMPYIILQQCM